MNQKVKYNMNNKNEKRKGKKKKRIITIDQKRIAGSTQFSNTFQSKLIRENKKPPPRKKKTRESINMDTSNKYVLYNEDVT